MKDMRSGEQKRMKSDEAAAFIRRSVEERNRTAIIKE